MITFTGWYKMEKQKDPKNMFPPPMDAQTAVHFMARYLLGDDWCVVDSLAQDQINTEIVYSILEIYSKSFNKESSGKEAKTSFSTAQRSESVLRFK